VERQSALRAELRLAIVPATALATEPAVNDVILGLMAAAPQVRSR
jgi:hypothetical protein